MGINKTKNPKMLAGFQHQQMLKTHGIDSNIEEKMQQLYNILQELGGVVNNQGDMLKRQANRLSEVFFKMSKMDEQIQLLRNNIRMNRDKFTAFIFTLEELGIIDKYALELSMGMLDQKILPITYDGRINSSIILRRYNPPPDLSLPEGAL